MNNFMRTGQKSGASGNDASTSDEQREQQNDNCDMKVDAEQSTAATTTEADESSALAETTMITSNQPKVAIDIENVLKVIENAENGIAKTEAGSAIAPIKQQISDGTVGANRTKKLNSETHKRGAVAGPDPTKPLQPKAKLLRQQRKAEKLLAKANATAMDTQPTDAVDQAAAAKKPPKNTEKTLQSFINEMAPDGKHTLKVSITTFYFYLNQMTNKFLKNGLNIK